MKSELCLLVFTLLYFCSGIRTPSNDFRIFQTPLKEDTLSPATISETLVIEDDDGWFYNTVIELGTPPQSFRATIDIGWSDTFVPSLLCIDRECTHHRLYDHAQSTSYRTNGTTVQMHYAGFYTSGFASVDTLRIGNMTILNQAFEEATLLKPVPMWDDFFDSAIGLSRLQVDDAESSLRATSVFHNMIQQGLLDRNLFSLRLSDSRSNISGELRFASTNTDLYVEPLITFPVTTVYSPPDLNPPDMDRYANVFLQAGWQVSAHSISLTSSSSGTSDTSSFSLTGYVAAFSTVYPYIMLPQTVRESILGNLGAFLGVVDCDTVDSQPSLVISLGGQNNSSPFALKPWDYIRKVPKWTFDDDDDFECQVQIASYNEPPDGVKFIVLGGAFLAQWYSVFDYDNATISLAALK